MGLTPQNADAYSAARFETYPAREDLGDASPRPDHGLEIAGGSFHG